MARETVWIDEFSLRVPAEDASMWEAAASGDWEAETLSALDDLVGAGDIVIDVGAYIGICTVVAARKRAHVHAFEPDPVARASLQRMLELNPEIALQVTVHAEALGATDRKAKLSSERLGNSGSSLARRQADTIEVTVRDAATALSECGLSNSSLLKIDVEGAEYEILPRLLPQLRQASPSVLLAVHTSYLREPLARFPSPVRGILYRLRALPRQARLIAAVRKLGPTYIALPNSGRWDELRGIRLILALLRVGEKELLVRPAA